MARSNRQLTQFAVDTLKGYFMTDPVESKVSAGNTELECQICRRCPYAPPQYVVYFIGTATAEIYTSKGELLESAANAEIYNSKGEFFDGAATAEIYNSKGELLGGLPRTLPRLKQYTLIKIAPSDSDDLPVLNEPVKVVVPVSFGSVFKNWFNL